MAWLDSSSLIAWGLKLRTLRQRHARATAWSIAVLLGGGTALSLAVAPLAPDAALLPQRIITETVQTEPIEPQLEALAALDLALSRTEVSRAGENLAALFKRLGFNAATDLTPIMLIERGPLVLMVRNEAPYQSVKELLGSTPSAKDRFASVAATGHLPHGDEQGIRRVPEPSARGLLEPRELEALGHHAAHARHEVGATAGRKRGHDPDRSDREGLCRHRCDCRQSEYRY